MTREKRKSQGDGYIYAITNPAWPGYTKLGRTFDLHRRLEAYQTGSPKRDYVVSFSRWFPDVLAAERKLSRRLPGFRTRGEWHHLHALDAAEFIRNL